MKNNKKKNVIILLMCSACTMLASPERSEEKVLKFSREEWNAVVRCVDTNGCCRITNQNAAIVITNGLYEMERVFPYIEDRLELNRLRIEESRKKRKNVPFRAGPEPMPYVGQGDW